MASSLFYGDNNLHQAVIETLYACNRDTETFGDNQTDTTAGPPRLLHRTEIYLSSLQCFYHLARAARQRTHIQRCYAGLAYVKGLSD
ncbi:unnamed protein product [Heligmosomoides polygyrus]|uniref:TED_complement domain-containing protein n=1 Tax=Heligmosomoides polygyrus TaxID=6339 RepID=A0A183FQA8_HELPZ|nr:unnamed protein product [Heligmosomoides polygyrus]